MAQASREGPVPFDDTALLLGMCHAFGSEPDVDELLVASGRWISAALRGEALGLRFIVTDVAGRLRSVHAVGDGAWHDPAFRRAKVAMESRSSRRVDGSRFGGTRIMTVPLVSRGVVFGAVEVATAVTLDAARWDLVEAVVSQTAVALANEASRSAADRGRDSIRAAIELGAAMVGAASCEGAIRRLVRGLHRDLGVRSAGWVAQPGRAPQLVSAGGLGSRRRDHLRSIAATDPDEAIEQAMGAFASVIGHHRIDVIDRAGALVLMEAPSDPATAEATSSLRAFAGEWFGWWSAFDGAKRRSDRFETALLVTAHEIRGPMLAARATIDAMLEQGGHAPEDRARLRRSRQQLEELAESVDVLLRWSGPAEEIRRRRTDLTRLIDGAITSVVAETGEDRVVFEPPLYRVTASVSRRHVSLAVANLVRNAIAYSPPGSPVVVEAALDSRSARISVRDRGGGIAADDEHVIFQPFVRGRSARADQAAGSGLGLYVVRKVAEAHGGSVWVERGRSSTTFHLSLPLRGTAPHTKGERHPGSDR